MKTYGYLFSPHTRLRSLPGNQPIRALISTVMAVMFSSIAWLGSMQIVLADQCAPTGNVGTCNGCEQCTVIDLEGNVCTTSIVCTGPGWPMCQPIPHEAGLHP